MIDLNDPIWSAVHSAGGPVDQQLRRLLAGEGDLRENMDALAEDLAHQLSWYDATAYALPHLAQLCEKLSVEEKLYLIAQMGPAVAAESQVSLSPDSEAYREFHEGLAPLAQEARELVENHMEEIKALPKDLPLFFANSALALLWDRKRAWYLYLCAPWDELPAMCPNCDWYEECMDFSLEEEPEFGTRRASGSRSCSPPSATGSSCPGCPICTGPVPARSVGPAAPSGLGWTTHMRRVNV